MANEWVRPSLSSGNKSLDGFFTNVSILCERTGKYAESMKPKYEIRTYYLDTDAGTPCKAVKMKSDLGRTFLRIPYETSQRTSVLGSLEELVKRLKEVSGMREDAAAALKSLGDGAGDFEKLFRQGCEALDECMEMADRMCEEVRAEVGFLKSVLDNEIPEIDGKRSTEQTVLSALPAGETPPADNLQPVRYFVVE